MICSSVDSGVPVRRRILVKHDMMSRRRQYYVEIIILVGTLWYSRPWSGLAVGSKSESESNDSFMSFAIVRL